MIDYMNLMTPKGHLHLGNWKKFSKDANFLENLRQETMWLDAASDLERLYVITHSLSAVPKCRSCEKEAKFKLFKTGYSEYCSIKCSVNAKEIKDQRTLSWVKKYGKGTEGRKNINDKIIKNNQKKYGTDSHNQVKSIKEKQKESKIRKYGLDYAKAGNEAAKETLKDRYGVNNAFQLPQVRSKAIESQRKHAKEGFELLLNKDSAERLYNQGTIKQIGNTLGISFSNVASRLKEHNITLNKYSSKSGLEKEVLDYIKSIYFGKVISGDRSVLGNGQEVDIFLPDLGIGVEFDGIFWHSNIDKNYHLNKTKRMEEQGFSLYHIFEDEWIEKKHIWKSMLANKLGVSRKIFGRKCTAKSVDKNIGAGFFKDNHMQGSLLHGEHIGLYHNDELVSCLSYGPSRYDKGMIEIYRYANKLNTRVIGGFSKLLKMLGDNPIVSYANRRWSEGNLYNKCGFTFIQNTPPNYYYVKDGKRFSRQSFQKHKLKDNPNIKGFDLNLTENEIMNNNGFRRIYDCGNKKFVINNRID